MTVFLIVARYTTRMTEIRREIFGEDFWAAPRSRWPVLPIRPLTEIQGIAVCRDMTPY